MEMDGEYNHNTKTPLIFVYRKEPEGINDNCKYNGFGSLIRDSALK